jgi:hypothetical protein
VKVHINKKLKNEKANALISSMKISCGIARESGALKMGERFLTCKTDLFSVLLTKKLRKKFS